MRLRELVLSSYDDPADYLHLRLNTRVLKERYMPSINRRSLMISSGWIQAAVIVLIIGFFIMGVLTYYTYNDEPPFLKR